MEVPPLQDFPDTPNKTANQPVSNISSIKDIHWRRKENTFLANYRKSSMPRLVRCLGLSSVALPRALLNACHDWAGVREASRGA